ncbi:MAG TPA: histidine phosphatase family protein [Bryobacteraceae bacterium]|nr:histidine phosphatase family protein [Bryobacteraceae bacterium]
MKAHILPAFAAMAVAALPGAAQSQPLSGRALVTALRQGGYVIVMRHASSPSQPPEAHAADPENTGRERQLDEKGRTTAAAMGEALRRLKIPIGEIFSSPTYRALETVRLAQLGNPHRVPELGDGGRGMKASTEQQAEWLRTKVKQFPAGTNTLIVTHSPNMQRAFPQWTEGLEDGEALILGPDSKGGATLVARVKIEQWPRLTR